MRVLDPKKIKTLMVVQDVSARALATAVGYSSHSYVTRILRGEIKTVTPERAARFAEFFGVGMDDLFVPRMSSTASQTTKRRGAAA